MAAFLDDLYVVTTRERARAAFDEVADAVAEVAKINAPKKKQNEDALEELKALEKKAADKTISTKDVGDFGKTWDLGKPTGSKTLAPGKFRTKLQTTKDNLDAQGQLDGETVVLNKKLDLLMLIALTM